MMGFQDCLHQMRVPFGSQAAVDFADASAEAVCHNAYQASSDLAVYRAQLIERYGPLLSLTELSELLKRSPDDLRIALYGQSDFAQQWNAAKRKVSRRVYFRANEVASLIDAA